MPDISSAPLYFQDDAYATFTDLRAHCRRLHTQRDIRLIVVDALYLLTYGTRPFASRHEEISEIARCLKLLAKELDVPVIAISQLNRGPEQRTDKKPQLNDLRDSGALKDIADVRVTVTSGGTRRTSTSWEAAGEQLGPRWMCLGTRYRGGMAETVPTDVAHGLDALLSQDDPVGSAVRCSVGTRSARGLREAALTGVSPRKDWWFTGLNELVAAAQARLQADLRTPAPA